MESGVYMIKNIINGKYYIGSSTNIHKRFIGHLCYLRKNKHHSRKLQLSFNKYGESAFIFGVIEYCEDDELETLEQLYLDTYFNEKCLNILKEAYTASGINHPRYGKTHSLETRLKIKEARSKQTIKHSQETKDKISYGNIGKKVDMEHIYKMIRIRSTMPNPNLGKKRNKPSKSKIILSQKIVDLIIKEYNEGYSIEQLRLKFQLDWNKIKTTLKENNIITRNISQQKILNYERRIK